MGRTIVKTIKKPTGRPSKFIPTTVNKVLHALKIGSTVETACQYAKISPQIFYEEMKRNEAFLEEVNSAREFARIRVGTVLNKHILNYKKEPDNSLKAAMFYLERKYPQEFGVQPSSLVQVNTNTHNNYIEFVEEEDKK